jgi:hypothetical protein
MPSSPPPDRFQREIDDIIRLAERRLEHQSFGHRMRRSSRRLSGAMGGFNMQMPSAETLGGAGLALLLLSWLLSLPIIREVPLAELIQLVALSIGIVCLIAALTLSIVRGRRGGLGGGGDKMWRGERISYSSPYGDGFLGRLRRILRGR